MPTVRMGNSTVTLISNTCVVSRCQHDEHKFTTLITLLPAIIDPYKTLSGEKQTLQPQKSTPDLQYIGVNCSVPSQDADLVWFTCGVACQWALQICMQLQLPLSAHWLVTLLDIQSENNVIFSSTSKNFQTTGINLTLEIRIFRESKFQIPN